MTAGRHHPLAPSGQGTVLLDIGEGIGALVVHAPGRLHGREIEVSPIRDAAVRTHAVVRARYVRGGVRWSAVLGHLPAGRYVVWRDPVTPLAEVEVAGGRVTEYEWPAAPASPDMPLQ